MITEHITYDRATELIERAIAERGEDYVYDPGEGKHCSYFHEDGDGSEPKATPGCIVGLALSYVGLTYEEVVENNVNTSTCTTGLLNALGVSCDAAALDLLELVQDLQDNGEPYLQAYRSALEEIAEDGDA